LGLIVIATPGSQLVDAVVAFLTRHLRRPEEVHRAATPGPLDEPCVLLSTEPVATSSGDAADAPTTQRHVRVVVVDGVGSGDGLRAEAHAAAAIAAASGGPFLVVVPGVAVAGGGVKAALGAAFGPEAVVDDVGELVVGEVTAGGGGVLRGLSGFHDPGAGGMPGLDEVIARLVAENDGLRAAMRDADAANARLTHELDRERRHALAAESGAAEVADHFEEFRDRRLVRLATRAADRFYPVVAGLAGRRDTTEHDASIERLRTGPLSVRTGLGSAIRGGARDRALTVIIPVYNAPAEVRRCLAAVASNSPAGVGVIIVHDASTDPGVAPVVAEAARREGWTLFENDENLGFTRSVNRGLVAAPAGDVVILNADTRVPRRWLWRLRNAALSDERIGTVTPLSDAAGAFSFACPRPDGPAEIDRFAAAVARGSAFVRPHGPTGNGFCMYVTAAAREVVPLLDEEAFPRGYGEENDYCMRLSTFGFSHVVADDCVVFHDESASFGSEKVALSEAGSATLERLWPDYHERAVRFVASEDLRRATGTAASSVATLASGGPPPDRRRVLAVVHDGFGGTQNHVDDLARHLDEDHETFTLVPEYSDVAVRRFVDDRWEVVHRWHPVDGWHITEIADEDRFDAYVDVLSRLDIDVVHIHHLLGQTFDLVEAARALGIPVVMSAHDYYLACPSLNLLDEKGDFCGGACTAGPGPCPTIERWVPADVPLKHGFVADWQASTRRLLGSIDALVAPSQAAVDVLAGALGDAVVERAHVIGHGTASSGRRRGVARAPVPGERVRVVVVGVLAPHKGSETLRSLAATDERHELDLGVLGVVDADHITAVADLPVTFHGGYRRTDLARRLGRLRPAFVAVLSPSRETFSYVVSEAWSLGIPVVVGEGGAPAERVRAAGGGIVVDLDDPVGAVQAIVDAGRDRNRWELLAAQACSVPLRDVSEMAADYRDLYSQLIATPDAEEHR
jgi:GT2 family glycosyltransferase/glycosyltransferase involved in cell wall biosynthesis